MFTIDVKYSRYSVYEGYSTLLTFGIKQNFSNDSDVQRAKCISRMPWTF